MQEKMNKYLPENLLYLPLGGSGEIGMNCNLYHLDNKWIMVDLGVTFNNGDSNSYDLIMPDIEFILEQVSKLSALILTHAHEDHIGAVPYLYKKIGKIPIYTTSFTASVLRRKFLSEGIKDYEIKILEYGDKIKIGSFTIEIFCMTHSIPESSSVLIKTKKGNIFHSGDWKIDPQPLVGKPIDSDKLKKFVDCGVDVMVCDSTNVFNFNQSGSESEVRENLNRIFSKKKKGKIVITSFASNIARIESILKVSQQNNKCCVLLGRSIKRIYESAVENNYLMNFKNIISEKEAKIISEDDLVIICTGSQGEERAALSRLVNGKHKFLNLTNNDTVIFSSREIPGNEQKINNVKSRVMKIGGKLLDHTNSKVHVSGHPSKNELKKMYNWINPRLLIPTHGEYRHLSEHVRFSKECGIKNQLLVENGDLVKLDNNEKKEIISRVVNGRSILKGNQIISINNKLLNELNKISSDGQIFINLIMDLENNLLTEPVIFCPSILIDENSKDELKQYLTEQISELSNHSIDDKILSDEIKLRLKNLLSKKIGLKPLTVIEIVRI